MSFFGKIGGFLKGAGKVAGLIPGVGGIAGGLAGKLGSLLQGGGGGGEGGGGGLSGMLKLLMGGAGAATAYGDYKQSKKDSKYARALADESLANYRQARQHAQDRWAEQSPLRDAFNYGAFNVSDPTNPFSRGQQTFSQFAPQQGAPPFDPSSTQNTIGTGGAPNGLMSMLQRGGRTPGRPTMRSASVKSGRNNQDQDRGRDRSRRRDEERDM